MRELEKILEEIDKASYVHMPNEQCIPLRIVKEIIRKHMNDGWIQVEERLPDNSEDVLVTTDVGLITFGYVSHGKWITDQEPDYPIAWRPLPEPYRPERSEGE